LPANLITLPPPRACGLPAICVSIQCGANSHSGTPGSRFRRPAGAAFRAMRSPPPADFQEKEAS